MRPRADQALAWTGERGEQVEDRLAVWVGPAADRVDGALHGRVVVGRRARVPVVVAPLVGEPGLRERDGLLETLEPELPPALAHEVGVRRADAHREHGRRPGKELAAEDAAAVVFDVRAVAVCAGADRDDGLERGWAASGGLQRGEAAPRKTDHPERARAPGLRSDPLERGADVLLLLLGVLVEEDAARGAAPANVHAKGGVSVLGEIGVADCVATAGVVLVPIGRDLDDRGHRSGVRSRRQPEVRGEASSVRQWDPEVVDLADGGALGTRRAMPTSR